jgi:hypothetical protein
VGAQHKVVRSPGGVYSGGWLHGKAQGEGTIRWSQAAGDGYGSYSGGWKGGMFHGRGVHTWPAQDGRVLDGTFVAGKVHGHATYTLHDGTFYRFSPRHPKL